MKRMLTVLAAVISAAAAQAITVNAPEGQTVKQGAVTGEGLTATGLGTIQMTGNNSLTSFDMSGMADTTAQKGGRLIFASENGEEVENSIGVGVTAVNYAALVFSNSVTTVSGSMTAANPLDRLEVYGGKLTASGQQIFAGNGTPASPWSDAGTLYFDGCTVNARYIGVNSNGQYGKLIVTNGASVVAERRLNIPSGEIRIYEGSKLQSSGGNGENMTWGGLLNVDIYQTGGTLSVGAGAYWGCGTNPTKYYLSGGECDCTGGTVMFGHGDGKKGYVYQSGGTFKLSNGANITANIGNNGYAYYEISGGTLDVYTINNVNIGVGTTSEGELRILGGKVICNALVGGTGKSTVTFNGGTFEPNLKSKTMSWLTASPNGFIRNLTAMRIGSKGGTLSLVKSNNQTVYTTWQAISDWTEQTTGAITPETYLTVGAFTKGGGTDTTLVLSNACTYSCATAVDAGTLKLFGDDILPSTTVLRLKSGTTLDLNGTTQHVTGLCGAGTVKNGTLVVSGYVMPGLGDAGGTLTIDSTATVTSDGFAMYVKDDGVATGDIAGALTLTANAKVTVATPENIKNRQASLTLGNGCTLTANGVTSTLKGYVAGMSGKTFKLSKPGLFLVVQ